MRLDASRALFLLALAACNGGDDGEDSGNEGGLTAPEIGTDPAEQARSDADVTAVILTESTGAAEISYRYDWTSGGTLWQQQTLPATATARGETWTLTVTPTAGELTGPTAQAQVAIVNSPPTLDGATFASAPATGQDLTCVPGTASDPDGDSVSFLFAWAVEGTAQSETSDTLSGSLITAGETITCTVTPTDGTDEGEPVVVTADGQNQPPVASGVSLTPTDATTADVLQCAVASATDPDGDVVTLRYAWLVDGAAVSGQTSNNLPAQLASRGESVLCRVTPTDGVYDGDPVDSNAVVIANAPPVASAEITPAGPVSSQDLTCAGSATDADGDSPSFTYAWDADGTAVGTGATLPAGLTERDRTYTCTATADDGFGGTDSGTDSVFVLNSAPTLTGASISPSAPTTTQALTCTAQGYSDPDGDAAQNQYVWLRGGTQVGTGPTLLASETAKGQSFTCQVTPGDGQSLGSPVTSAPVTVVNSPPTAPDVTLNTTVPAAQADELVCEATTSTDDDSDTLSYTLTWYVDGDVYTGPTASTNRTGDTIPALDLRACHSYHCEVSVTDQEATVGPIASRAVTAQAHPTCGGGSSCPTGAIADGPYYDYGTCLWLGTDGASCDDVCAASASQGGAPDNASPAMHGKWASACTDASNHLASPTGWFYEHGNEGGWASSASSGPNVDTIGFGVRGGSLYGACHDTSLRESATWPGFSAGNAESYVCACGDRRAGSDGSENTSTNWVPSTFSRVIVPDETTLLHETSVLTAHLSTTPCTMSAYLFVSESGSLSGPWTTIGSWPNIGTQPVSTRQTVVHPATDTLLEAGKAYAFGISSNTCSASMGRDTSGATSPLGTVGYCLSAADGSPPSSTQCSASWTFPAPVQSWIRPM